MSTHPLKALPSGARWKNAAFTIMELLIVIAIMILIIGFTIPSILNNGSNVNKMVYDVSGVFQEARGYAMANNTFAWVGIAEIQQSQMNSVIMAVVASRDGTKIYDEADPETTWASAYTAAPIGGRLVQVGKLIRIENAHLANGLGPLPSSGNMARRLVPAEYQLGNPDCVSVLNFPYPLGRPMDGGQYNFKKIIQFDSQGGAKLVKAVSNYATLEVCLQPTHGNVTPAVPSNPNIGNHAAIQIDGMTGTTLIFRP